MSSVARKDQGKPKFTWSLWRDSNSMLSFTVCLSSVLVLPRKKPSQMDIAQLCEGQHFSGMKYLTKSSPRALRR